MRRAGWRAAIDPVAPLSITWLGHATVLIKVDGTRLLTDPMLRPRVGPLVRISPPVDLDDLQELDGVLLSHLHADHADVPSLRRVARGVPVLAPRGAGRWLTRRGLPDVTELSAGADVAIGGLRIVATPAVHDPRRSPFGPAAAPIGFLVRGVYFAGDTDLFAEMAGLRGSVETALLPVWGWGPSLGPGHLDPHAAARAAALIEPTVAIPIHWGTYAIGWPGRRPADPSLPARQFREFAAQQAPGAEVRVLMPGEVTRIG